MKIFDRIRQNVVTTEAKFAFIDLACVIMQADNRSSLSEQSVMEFLISLESDSAERLELRYQMTMTKVNNNGFNRDSFLNNINQRLTTSELKDLARDFSIALMQSDEKFAVSEQNLLESIHKVFAA